MTEKTIVTKSEMEQTPSNQRRIAEEQAAAEFHDSAPVDDKLPHEKAIELAKTAKNKAILVKNKARSIKSKAVKAKRKKQLKKRKARAKRARVEKIKQQQQTLKRQAQATSNQDRQLSR